MPNVETEKKVYVGVMLSDIHAGAFDAEQWYHELDMGFIPTIKKLAILDYIIITGDYFDSKISLNAKSAKYALKFLNVLLDICEEKGAKLRIIKGTESHDNKQLEILNVTMERSTCDAKIIETVSSEYLFPDLRILYIPEEYMVNKDEYYEEHFKEEYDLIAGHGLVDQALYFAATQESESTMSKAPVLNLDTLLKICRGYIYFGHIHKRMVIKERFRYVNSYSRWAFGEEEDKGFCIYYYEPESGECQEEYVINEYARRFDTVEVTCNHQTEASEKEQVDYLINLAKTFLVDHLRMEVTVPEEHPNPTLITKLISEVFARQKNIKLKIINNGKLKQEKEIDNKVKKILETYGSVIFDKKSLPEEKLSKYIQIRYKRDISVEEMRQYLYESLTMKGV